MVLKLSFDKTLENRFRELAMRRYGFSKGAISKASKDAIIHWIKENDRSKLSKNDKIFRLIEGKLKHLRGKYTSVELQHEARNLWGKKK